MVSMGSSVTSGGVRRGRRLCVLPRPLDLIESGVEWLFEDLRQWAYPVKRVGSLLAAGP